MGGFAHTIFAAVATERPDRDFLVIPPSASAGYAPEGVRLSYGEAMRRTGALRDAYAGAGYGHGHRVALLLENRPEMFLHLLALNGLGVSIVPVNPFYQLGEMAYLLGHSDALLAVSVPDRMADLSAASAQLENPVPVIAAGDPPPAATRPPPEAGAIGAATEAALLYTSGTTGRPKGCMLSNEYFSMMADWYVAMGPLAPVERGAERILTPLPMFHMNAMCASFLGAVRSANTLIQLDRFHPRSWWADVAGTGATIIHYLGVMPAILLGMEEDPAETAHSVKFGFGANLDPAQHEAFEKRFGFPLIEGWGMTEAGAGAMATAATPPHRPGRRSIGTFEGYDVRLVDDDDRDVAAGTPGRLLVRHSAATPRKGFFSGYYKEPEATEKAWATGWFDTGDIVRRDEAGEYFFEDRAKNIIRRAGENIAALEVETALIPHPAVGQIAVIAVPDEKRDEEVCACIVAAEGAATDEAAARDIVRTCLGKLAYYKAPGWVLFVDSLPTTATNKVRKTSIAELGGDPRENPDVFDLREMKKAPKRRAG